MKRILLILLALTLILLPGCAEEPDTDIDGENKIHTSQVVSKKMAEYGDYLYIVEDGLCCYNRQTGELRSFCTDPDCGYSCVFCNLPLEITQVTDGRLYFNGTFVRTRENFFAYVDLVTEEATVLLTLPKNGTSILSPPVLDNGWLYYTVQRLREGGEATNSDDYEFCVERIPMDGGESEFVCLIKDNVDEKIYAVIDGKVLTICRDVLCVTDSQTGERKVLFDPEEHGFFRHIEMINYLDGYFYCIVYTSELLESEYILQPFRKCYLLKINARTGEIKQLIKEPVYGLIVTDDTIYYTEQAKRELYVPEDYAEHPENVVWTCSYETLYACDLDGNNRREVYTNPYLDLNNFNRVINECLYGWISTYDEAEHKRSSRFFAKLDLATGEITPATYVD